jgi:hypothetical protein
MSVLLFKAGRAVTKLMTNGAEPTRAKLMVCGGETLAFASIMACRKEPAPESLTFITVKVAAKAHWQATNRIKPEQQRKSQVHLRSAGINYSLFFADRNAGTKGSE